MNIDDPVSRRRFLKVGLAAAGATAAAACRPVAPAPAPPAPAPAPTPTTVPPAPFGERVLVVIEMAGGNDGYSTVVPYTNGAYYSHRPTVAVPANQVLPITGDLGWHPNLARISHRPMAVVEGVGGVNPSESHFEMMRRWWSGDTNGQSPQPTGFFGRICDTVGDPSAPATGVSLGWGTTPALVSAQAVTLSMSPYGDASFPGPGDATLNATWMAAQRAMANPDRLESTIMYTARYGAYNALRFSDVVSSLPPSQQTYPDTGLGAQLATAVRLIRAGIGTRVVYVPFGGSFDTHENHLATHSDLMAELDGALDAFLSELAALNLTRKVLVATFSEFGRRADQNTDGLDHGTTSVMLLTGAVNPGVYGSRPSWTNLDANGNLVSTVDIGQYYATLASWFGIHPGDVLPGNPSPIPGILG
ncbi:MAG TPA: DUF1501 domain-containing protein [Acidimicrobiia bacterium]|nr:DUF1501 domain-containing protein [Acidimicrobiia bacterium]